MTGQLTKEFLKKSTRLRSREDYQLKPWLGLTKFVSKAGFRLGGVSWTVFIAFILVSDGLFSGGV